MMDIALKYKIVEKIIHSNDDDSLINELESLLGFSDGDFWGDVPEDVKKTIGKANGKLDNS